MRWPTYLLTMGCVPLVLAERAEAQTKTHEYDELGRVVVSETNGGTHDGKARSTCFDPAGNRTDFESSTSGSTLTCADPPAAPPPPGNPPPPPPPPPPPSNSPPVTEDDVELMGCDLTMSFDVAGDDEDAEDDPLPPTLTAITPGGVIATASVSDGLAEVSSGLSEGTQAFTYTVEDSQGLTATGQLTVHVVGCGGPPGGGNPL